jgi:hypothetical protein
MFLGGTGIAANAAPTQQQQQMQRQASRRSSSMGCAGVQTRGFCPDIRAPTSPFLKKTVMISLKLVVTNIFLVVIRGANSMDIFRLTIQQKIVGLCRYIFFKYPQFYLDIKYTYKFLLGYTKYKYNLTIICSIFDI